MTATAARLGKKTKKLAPAFVMTVALLVVPQGCGGNVDDGSGPGSSAAGTGGTGGTTNNGGASGSTPQGGSGGSTNAACPKTQPTSGACTGDQVCSYTSGSGCPAQTSRCVDGKWVASFTSCNPPPPPCPDGPIVEGESCPGGGFGQTTCPRTVDGCNVTFVCQGTWKKTADSCATCPKSAPTFNSACPQAGLSCDYATETSCPYNFTCTGGRWTSDTPPCNPPPPPDDCPDSPPAAGSACELGGKMSIECGYPVTPTCTERFSCSSGKWQRASAACDLPAMPACGATLDQKTCAAEAGCRWLQPGCASPPQTTLGQAGCFASTNCTSDGDCLAGRTCKTVVIDPCAGGNCDACGQEVKVCN